MPEIKIIFFDIDDTLIRKDDGYQPPALACHLRALHQRGILTAIATGRSAGIIPPAVHQLMRDAEIDILSTANGQYATRGGEVLHEHPLPAGDITALIALAERRGWAYLQHGADKLCASRLDRRVMPAMFGVQPWYVDPDYHRHRPLHQFGLFINEAEIRDLTGELSALSLSRDYHATPWHDNGCDLIPVDGGKARGIREICAALNLSPENAAAFGDGLNDITMLESVGLGIAMGNACDELKRVAAYTTDTLENHGIEKALRHFQLL